MSCSDQKKEGPPEDAGTFQKVRQHVKEFVEATPEQHSQ